jgi:hypothetical protein
MSQTDNEKNISYSEDTPNSQQTQSQLNHAWPWSSQSTNSNETVSTWEISQSQYSTSNEISNSQWNPSQAAVESKETYVDKSCNEWDNVYNFQVSNKSDDTNRNLSQSSSADNEKIIGVANEFEKEYYQKK